MAECSDESCLREVWHDLDKCILHCEKIDYGADAQTTDSLRNFYDSLVDYVIENHSDPEKQFYTEPELRVHLSHSGIKQIPPDAVKAYSHGDVEFSRIWFPSLIGANLNNYRLVLGLFGRVRFEECIFSTSTLGLRRPQLVFQKCIFLNKWLLENHQVMRGLCEYIYEECQFKKEISISYDAQAEGIENPLFDQCHFEDKIRLQNTSFESMVFSNNLEQKTQHSDKLLIEIDGCVFNKMFALSALSFADINVKQSQFKSDFWLKSCKIKNLQITSTVFDASTDFEGSTFDNFFISRTIFKDFASFVDCKFGDSDESSIENRTTFDFVTFLGFCSFRSSNFNQGLNLQNTSMKETPNFHGLYLKHSLTDKETLRIIKNSFDKVGNYIEGNRFYKYEMLKHQEDLFNKGLSSESILFSVYKISSDFGQSIIRPILWFALTAFVYWLLIETKNVDLIFKILPESTGDILNDFFMIFNSMTKYIIPYKTWLEPGMEFLSLIFYIIFTSLIWLVILAIKRHTKR